MAFSDPQHIVDQFGILDGRIIADCGAGSGFYTIQAAKLVGEHGKVYAIDIQEELLVRLKSNLAQQNITNVELIHADLEENRGTKIQDGHVDGILLCNVFFQFEKKLEALNEIKRILKPNGRVLFVEWSDSFNGLGPQPEYIIPKKAAQDLFNQLGFVEVSELKAGEHHYGLIFRKQ